MPHNPYHPPAKKFKPGSAFFRLDKNKPGMLLPKKGNIPTPLDVQRKRLPIYQAKPQLLNQLRQLPSAILIGNVTFISLIILALLKVNEGKTTFQCSHSALI